MKLGFRSGLSPERETLAAAIAALGIDNEERRVAEAAEGRAALKVTEAGQRRDAAQRAVEAARQEDAAALLSYAETGADAPGSTGLRDARLALADAEDAMEAAASVLLTVRGRAAERHHGYSTPAMKVDAAAKAVLAAATGSLATDLELMQREIVRRRIALRALMKANLVADMAAAMRVMARVSLPDYNEVYGDRGPQGWDASWEIGAGAEWFSALEALKRDPSAPVPGGRLP